MGARFEEPVSQSFNQRFAVNGILDSFAYFDIVVYGARAPGIGGQSHNQTGNGSYPISPRHQVGCLFETRLGVLVRLSGQESG